ncbi:MAG TPA: dTDP-glucose 4,6-dehydratase [Bdellovibrionales bacterium]|nr:dTDP-glucose 4,6-dehydratase [Bdellovibrionales bacterium]
MGKPSVKNVMVTGGAGFIGSCFVEQLVQEGHRVVVFDALTYAGHRANLAAVESKIEFVEGDIRDLAAVRSVLAERSIDWIVNFAAESHVDRSIENAADFVHTNVVGVFTLLGAALEHFEKLPANKKSEFRFIQVSTDEVFGSLGETGHFTEETPYAPNSPYSASKAGGDHLARAWFHTYRLPVIITNCSNNYGPRQYPEKLIPHMIQCALAEKPLPVYGDGRNVRDWIHVSDHSRGIYLAALKGVPGESYCFGGRSERRNIDVVRGICRELDGLKPRARGSYEELISFVIDRKGHDWRYAIDDVKAERDLGFKREYGEFETGLKQTVRWYLENDAWVQAVMKESAR